MGVFLQENFRNSKIFDFSYKFLDFWDTFMDVLGNILFHGNKFLVTSKDYHSKGFSIIYINFRY